MKFINKNTYDAVEYAVNNPQYSYTKIGKMFGVDRHQITKYIKDNLYLKYTYSNKNKVDNRLYYFTENELKLISNYIKYPNKSYKEILIMSNSNIQRQTLYNYLDILGLNKTEGKSIKYHYKRNLFNKIESEEDAYWLGFITADGCIIENKWLSINLAERDIDHIKKFCKYAGLNNEETEEIIKYSFGGAYNRDNPIVSLKICSLEIINNLQNKGITPRKSGKEKPYICDTIDLQKAYVRGILDGDGYLCKGSYKIGVVGSRNICEYIKQFFSNNIIDLSNNTIREHGTIFKFEFSGKRQCKIVADYLYKDAIIYLDRKYKLYLTNYQ